VVAGDRVDNAVDDDGRIAGGDQDEDDGAGKVGSAPGSHHHRDQGRRHHCTEDDQRWDKDLPKDVQHNDDLDRGEGG
jgi:hypothetical protein